MNSEYEKRIELCFNAVRKATKKLNLNCHGAEDYQGIEVPIHTEVGQGKVIILMNTGHGPRFPKYITLTIHGYVENTVNSKVWISGGGIKSSKEKFLPKEISQKWLQDAILKSATAIKSICSTENMEKLKKEALSKRKQAVKDSPIERHQTTHLEIT